uniref:Uncharacterized protein n=1 Tax=Musa acuminata subsp. malaccensis TaxID=214687 RepID=A0A804HZX2_MUSAM|nr:PREDICTED: two-component response regulator-like PRR1 [Musa acuminata subsp. malaccensis]
MGRERVEEDEDEGWRCLNEGDGGGGGDAAGQRFFDRSKVRILLCDNDPKSSQEILQLLLKCSYQVTSARSARQVIDVLNAQGSEIDIILAEVELPMAKGLKMLKYIARNKDLRRIPIIIMSAQDEVSVVVKCLRLGAADYLMKPLRTNELLNLWTHMWRRRRMLGLTEKDVFRHDFEIIFSDPSDANTNSITLLSDDTDEKPSMGTNPELNLSNLPETESNVSPVEPVCNNLLGDVQNIPRDGDRAGGIFSLPKKTELKVGGSSAFLTYVKSSASSRMPCIDVDVNSAPSEPSNREESSLAVGDTARCNSKLVPESYIGGNGTPTSKNICNMKDFQTPPEFPTLCVSSSTEQQPQLRNEVLSDGSGIPPIFSLPFYYPGVMDQNILCSHGQLFQGSLNDVQAHPAPALLPHYGVVPRMPLIPSFPYQTFGINMQSGHVAAPNLSSSMTTPSVLEVKPGRIEKRAAALVKFRQKRKDRCFDKKIRYVNRKRLAEKRPRVRGQFVKQVNNVDVNQNVLGGGDGEFGDYEDDEPTSKELELISSPEQNASDC